MAVHTHQVVSQTTAATAARAARAATAATAAAATATATGHISQVCPRLRHLFCAFMLAAARAANETGAARTRQRRLRQWLRHERLSVAMALAEMQHHTAPRRPKKATAGEGGSELNHTASIRETPPLQPELFDLSSDEEPGGSWSDRLVGVRSTGGGTAAHRGAAFRHRFHGAAPR